MCVYQGVFLPCGNVMTLSTVSLCVCGRSWSRCVTAVLTQNTNEGKIMYCRRRGKNKKNNKTNQPNQQTNQPQKTAKKKPQTSGMIHMPFCVVVNEWCQLIELNVSMGILQRPSVSCSPVVKKSKQTPDLSEEENGIQQIQKAQWISQKKENNINF